nr:hypothetical protein [Tanacetum cinerariifolium]
ILVTRSTRSSTPLSITRPFPVPPTYHATTAAATPPTPTATTTIIFFLDSFARATKEKGVFVGQRVGDVCWAATAACSGCLFCLLLPTAAYTWVFVCLSCQAAAYKRGCLFRAAEAAAQLGAFG